MRGIDNSPNTAKIDSLFLKAFGTGVLTIGIGDGGNEIGMGNVLEGVEKHVPLGDKIGTKVKCDHLITAGVSNWGGYALAAALYSVAPSPTINMLPNIEDEENILKSIVDAGAVDGTTSKSVMAVDGMDWAVHKDIVHQINSIATE
eukprot:TRINITY_DN4792_c0_g1_i2.p1 TRINITY_DN4792_c0_g1~~TRINITY_DN4792_c0_g1_i2.p1  ORF type:complete len:146 (+),score=33.20 TRINITY_DN4792_c0_g1_i2:499-936(+)